MKQDNLPSYRKGFRQVNLMQHIIELLLNTGSLAMVHLTHQATGLI